MVSEQSSSDGSAVSWPIFCAMSWSMVVAIAAPDAPVSGRVAESQVAGLIECTEPALAALISSANE